MIMNRNNSAIGNLGNFILPTIVTGPREGILLDTSGDIKRLSLSNLRDTIRGKGDVLLCHRPSVAKKLGIQPFPSLDLLELFAFVHPAKSCVPTPRGLALALGLDPPNSLEQEAKTLTSAARNLMATLKSMKAKDEPDILSIAEVMRDGQWLWGDRVCSALAHLADPKGQRRSRHGLDAWTRRPSWTDHPSESPAQANGVDPLEARTRLHQLTGSEAEDRPEQSDYASAVTLSFAPPIEVDRTNIVIAEAGTGVGKTLGYIAPASIWAEKNAGAVWISTYTKHLQRQIDTELDKLHPDPQTKRNRVVIRKGRENYLCFLNMEEAISNILRRPATAVPLGLVSRWVAATRDGDVIGGDFPSWLADLVGFGNTIGLAERRGECTFSACPHYNKCFIEGTIRQARQADIVIANHALVISQAALRGLDDDNIPTRLIFDEGHHIFDSADSAFTTEISGRRGADLRRWILGNDSRAGRGRPLAKRLKDFSEADPFIAEALGIVEDAATCLPRSGWQSRIGHLGHAEGPAETFLALIRQQTYARTKNVGSEYGLETDIKPLIPEIEEAAELFEAALGLLSHPMKTLVKRLADYLDRESSSLDSSSRLRIDSLCRGIQRRAENDVDGWRLMLVNLTAETSNEFVEWFSVSRDNGHDIDTAMHRAWKDPTLPFAKAVIEPAHGALITSATLRDGTGDNDADWGAAERVTGAIHLPNNPRRVLIPSAFDYERQARVFIITDIPRDDTRQVAAAFRELFFAANGGAVGLFTAISRLQAIHAQIATPLEEAGIPVLAQHIDPLDTGSLIDIFRAEENSCLLGTDAIRDGVDVPGRALRLLVFDRVPWPRPTILHRERKKLFGGSNWDDRITRLRIKQGFGRLIRHGHDKGVFVMLDSRLPSRLLGAFPQDVPVFRSGLSEAINSIRDFLQETRD